MWPVGTKLAFTVTTLVIALPRQVVVQRWGRADVDLVLQDDRAVGPPLHEHLDSAMDLPSPPPRH